MTMTNTRPGSTSEVIGAGLTGTARTTGLLYLGLAVTGVLGFQLVRGQLYVADDPGGTLSNLVEHTSMARLGIVLELGIVLTQALAAVWFYRLFRSVDSFAAGLVAVFGMVNAVAILGSAAVLATALDVADDRSLAVSGGAAATAQLLYVISGHLWGVGGLVLRPVADPDGLARGALAVAAAVVGPAADGRRCGLRAQHLRQLRVRECRSRGRVADRARDHR